MKRWAPLALAAVSAAAVVSIAAAGLTRDRAVAQPLEDAKAACHAESFTLAQHVLYAKNVLDWTEAEMLGAVKAGDLIRNDVHAFIRAVFQGRPDDAKLAIKRVYEICVAVRSRRPTET